MKAFKRFYIWGMDTKRDMGVYFAALVFLCGLFFGRTMLWAGVSALAIFAAGWAGGWLAVGGPLPCALLGAFMFVGLFAMLVGERFKQEVETVQLNEALARHQKKP